MYLLVFSRPVGQVLTRAHFTDEQSEAGVGAELPSGDAGTG